MAEKTKVQLKKQIDAAGQPHKILENIIDSTRNNTDGGTVTLLAGNNLVGSSTSNIIINTNKFTVDGATGNTVVAGTLGVTGIATFTLALINAANVGAAGAATAVAEEAGDGKHHVTTLTLTDFIIGPLAGAAAAKVLVPPTALYVLPAGVQVIKYAYMTLALTAAGDAQTPELGLGSIVGDGTANADIGSAGATQEDYFEGTAGGDTDTQGVVATGPLGATAGVFTGIALNKAADSKNIFLNCADTWAANNTGNITATGTVVIVWDTIA